MRDRRIFFWAALSACLVLAFRPLLREPFALDDVGILHSWAVGRLLKRCLLPHFFRPLAAPVYWAYFEAAGPRPWGLRALMMLLHAVASLLIFRLALRLTRDAVAAALSACLYGFSIIHWSGLSLTAGLPQYACDALLWLAVVVYVEERSPARALALSLPLATAALLFKEHAVAFAVLAPAARWARRRRIDASSTAIFSCWALAYGALRLFGPRSVLDPGAHFRFSLTSGVATRLETALSIVCDLAAHPLPPFPAPPAWLAACACAALGLGWTVSRLTRTRRLDWRRAAAFGAVGFAAGAAPYLPFAGAVEVLAGGRLSLSCAAAAIGVGACLAAVLRARAAVATLCALLAARGALFFRAPDPDVEPFRLELSLRRTREAGAAVERALSASRNARVVALDGFAPELRLPWLLEATDTKRRYVASGEAGAPAPDLVVRAIPGDR